MGECERALETLQRAESICKDAFGSCDPAILAFTAMTLHRIGKSDAAHDALERAYRNNEDNRWSNRPDIEGFLAEAQHVIADSPQSAR